jgi:NAD(P)-dependent dehydrogenase (short-subunit alcohol dehydrogenase family)
MRKQKLRLEGSKASVIGASGGLGRAICKSLHSEGAAVTGLGRRAESVASAFAEKVISGRMGTIDLAAPETVAASLHKAL